MTRPVTSTTQEAFFNELRELIMASIADLTPGEVMGVLVLMFAEVGVNSEGCTAEKLLRDGITLLKTAVEGVYGDET